MRAWPRDPHLPVWPTCWRQACLKMSKERKHTASSKDIFSMKKERKKDDSQKKSALPGMERQLSHLHNIPVGNMVSRETNVQFMSINHQPLLVSFEVNLFNQS